jgi:hypothetical protein
VSATSRPKKRAPTSARRSPRSHVRSNADAAVVHAGRRGVHRGAARCLARRGARAVFTSGGGSGVGRRGRYRRRLRFQLRVSAIRASTIRTGASRRCRLRSTGRRARRAG